MKKELDLKKIERKAYFSYHQDGLVDILGGLWLLSFGIGILFDMAYMAAWIPAIWLPVWVWLKRVITYPRIGYVRFDSEKVKKKKNILSIVLGITLLLGIVNFLAFQSAPGGLKASLRSLGIIPLGFVISLVIGVAAERFHVRRGSFYVVAIMAIFVGGHVLKVHPFLVLILSGLALTIPGIVMLVLFLSRNPRVDSLRIEGIPGGKDK